MRWPSASVVLCFAAQKVAYAQIAPLSIEPSLYWDGEDGSWSTFQIQIGTPGQTVRLLPGTSANAGNSIWAIIPQGCTQANPRDQNCGNDRGWLFTSNLSTTWSTSRLANGGLYVLDTYVEGELGLDGAGLYGFDNVTLGVGVAGMPTLNNQLVAGIATNNYWLGSLGLSPHPFNFTSLDDPITSMLSTLRNQSLIPSTSWGYTAGAANNEPPVFGSLTLGGYDTSRFRVNETVSIPFGADFTHDLLIGLQSITYDTLGSSPLLSDGIYALLDSMVTQMWLPIPVCQAFEKAFNLTWNETTQLYLVSDDLHASLLAQNPSFTFTLGPSASASAPGGSSVEITFPYSAFDLTISPPYVNSTSRYFPLKQAQNSSQYTLGRVFFQQAYVAADYERAVFNVSQALFPASGTAESLVAIVPPVTIEGGKGSNSTATATPGSLSDGAIAGIVVGCVVLLSLVLAAAVVVVRRRRRYSPAPADEKDGDAYGRSYAKAELSAGETGSPRLFDSKEKRVAVESQPMEMEGSNLRQPGGDVVEHAGDERPAIWELDGGTPAAAEMEGFKK